jgi:tellurite resistance protein TehA-like permease
MATGIVGIAAHLLGIAFVPDTLLVLNVVFFAVLSVLFVLRALRYWAAFRRDFADAGRGVGFFTVVAASCVLGTQLVIQAGAMRLASGLFVLACILYPLMIYGVFAAITVRANKPDVRHGLNGAWLVAIVATQGLSVLGGTVYAEFAGLERAILLSTLCFWLVGGVLYLWIAALIFYRYMFLELEPAELGPPYWVDMGAAAISTLAGATLIANLDHHPLFLELAPFVKGLTLLFWSVATWWVPLLLILGFWRHVVRRFPLRYDPSYWAMVFPLGMYTVCTFKLHRALDLHELEWIPRVVIWFALAAWSVVFLGMLATLIPGKPRKRRFVPGDGQPSQMHVPAAGKAADQEGEQG